MSGKISDGRKAAYYIGIGLIVIGVLLFLSVFFSAMGSFGDPFQPPPFQNAVIGMILIVVGSIVSRIGAHGAAGSGIILDPEKAREDLKPFNQAKGGMINDMLENVDVLDKFANTSASAREVIKIKCRSCGELNDEDAKFCKECGKSL